MALTLTYPTLSSTASKTELEQNFSDITGKFGNIKNADIHASAAIATSKLAANDYEIVVPFDVMLFTTAGTHATPTASATVPVAVVGIPSISGLTYTGVAANYWCSDVVGTGNLKFKVEHGYYNAGTWTGATTVISEVTVATAATIQTGTATPSNFTGDANNRYIGLFITTDRTVSGTAYSRLCVTLRFKKDLI